MNKQHKYKLTINWTGNRGTGTSGYSSYERSHILSAENKAEVMMSSDPSFRGDKTKYNPEELLVASISSCHLLWYLHLCSDAKIVVIGYSDDATGLMQETEDGGGHFTEVVLHPKVVVKSLTMIDKANELHEKAHQLCFISRSVKFPVRFEAECTAET